MAAAVPVLANILVPGSGLIVALAFQVTGINEKINKAAVNVFGEDLVKVGNLAAIAYGAYDSGLFGGENAASAAEGLSAADMAGGLDPAFGTTEAYNAATNMTPNLGGMDAAANTSLSSTLDAVAPGMEIAEGTNSGFNLKDIAGSTKAAVPTVAESATASAQSVGDGQLIGLKPTVSAPGMSLNGAAASNATSDLYSLSTKATAAASNATKAATGPSSFLQRLKDTATSPVVLGSMIKGAAGGYASAAAQEAQREMYDKQMAERKRLASIGSAGYRVKG